MKALVLSPFYPPDYGGISSHVEQLATRLASRKWDARVIACSRKQMADKWYGDLKIEKIGAIYLPGWPLQTLGSFSIPIDFSRRFL